jgi:hypothetical protein
MSTSNIFGLSPQVLQASNTLLRLAEVDAILAFKDRANKLEVLTNLWVGVEEILPNTASAKSLLSQILPKIGKTFSRLYLEMSPLETEEDIRKCLHRMQKDVQSVLVPPVKKSFRGNKGPTFLIDYQRQFNSPEKNHSYVIKWTNREEIACHRVYAAFASNFNRDATLNPSSGFLVPALGCLDFANGVHEMTNGKQLPLSPKTCSELKNNFLRIAEIYYPDKISKSLLMICEKIPGENLFDFARTRYRLLNRAQKEKFFNRLGRLAMLDVVTGNLDRLIQIFTNRSGDYTLQDLEANLGNVMVVWSKESEHSPLLYAIDNGIETELIEDAGRRAKYLSFLQSQFASPDSIQMLAQNMLKSLQHALTTQIDDVSSGNIQELKKQLQAFSDELTSLAYPAIRLGLEEMLFHLQEHLIPGWENEKSGYLREYLTATYPQVYTAIQERIDTLKMIRRQS